jgi:TPR repeat protein
MDIQMKTRGLAHIEDLKQEALNQTSEIADRDYLPAQFDLFHRLSNGWQVKQDYAAAYYWGKRALKNGAKLRPELNALAKRLTLPNKNQIIKWENTITLPKLLLKK